MGYKDREQQRAYQREWMARRRAAWFEGKACVDCGATDELEVDHVDPSSKVDHKVWSWSASRREAELSKCEVRCRSCHQMKTVVNRDCSHRLTTQEVIEIREAHVAGVPRKDLAKAYGITRGYVNDLMRGDTRRHG